MMRKKWSSLLLFCCLSFCCAAQTAGYKFYTSLDSVKTSGFYNIAITPELSGHLKTDYSDLRVVNDSGKWVPHVLHTPFYSKKGMDVYMDLSIVKKENLNGNTTIEIAAFKNLNNNIILGIRNNAAERFCTLSGSDDGKNWFVINDSIVINPAPNATDTINTFKIDFPVNNYNFFKIVIHNNNRDPLDIKYATQYTSLNVLGDSNRATINPEVHIEQKDSGKISYIKITQQQAYHFENISLKLSGVKYFSRKVDLYFPREANNSFSNPGDLVASFTISNNSTLQFKIAISNAPVFYLLINNEDNLPLKVTEVITASNYRYISSYLEKGNRYKLILDNPTATLPNYDLAAIHTKSSDSIPYLSFGKLFAADQKEIATAPTKNNNWILWVAIIAALFILLLFTKKMMSEVAKRKQDDTI